MGRKSKIKQARRLQSTTFSGIITVDISDNNWFYCHGDPFSPQSKIIQRGSLDVCIDRAYKEIPTLNIEPRTEMRKHCGEYGLLTGTGWHLIYQPLMTGEP